MRECWINVYQNSEGKQKFGCQWKSSADAEINGYLAYHKLVGRLHVKMKDQKPKLDWKKLLKLHDG